MNRKLLFVDDDSAVLQGLQRMLRVMRNEWDMSFAESGQQALKIMKKFPVDMVVTDMRMPGMDGAQLLQEVKSDFPDTIRIILSGQADETAFMRSAVSMHQFLTKPCNLQSLKSAVNRAFHLQEDLISEDLVKLVSQMGSVPVLPQLYTELMEELNSPEYSIEKVGKIISKDIGMATKILQLANSAVFGFSQKVLTVDHAVRILGIAMIQSLVLPYQIFSKFDQGKLKQFSLDTIWGHSGRVGKCALKIAEIENMNEVFKGYCITGGMLHDIGKLLIGYYHQEKYQEILAFAMDNSVELCQAELSILNVTHDKVSAYLLGLWGLPDPLVEAVAYHHDPSKSKYQELTPLIIIYVANILANENESPSKEYPSSVIDENYLEKLGLLDRVPVWRKNCQSIFSEFD